MRAEAFIIAKKHGFPASQIRFSDKLEWIATKKGQLVLRKLRVDPVSKVVTIFIDAIEANRPNDAKQHVVETLDLALKFIGNGQWDEEEHPRDSDGKFTFAGNSDAGDAGDGYGGGLVAPEDKPFASKSKEKVKVKPEDFTKDKVRLSISPSAADSFIEQWNEKIGTTPADFANDFLGGVKSGEVTITATKDEWAISGNLYDGDTRIGDFTRNLRFNTKSAYSAYFSLNNRARGHDVGKQVLAGNVETYKKLGFTKLTVSANIDVGGYAWAKYGYVPTPDSWNSLRHDILSSLGAGNSSRSTSTTYTPESWDEVSDYDRDRIYDQWRANSYEEIHDNEIQNWHDSGESLRYAKQDIRDDFKNGEDEWAADALGNWRKEYEDKTGKKIPFSDSQILDAVEISYDDDDYEGQADPEISFDDSKLNELGKKTEDQPTLPGIEEPIPSKLLTDDMRVGIETSLIDAFNRKADDVRNDLSPPDYLVDQAREYQEEYWDQLDDEEKYRIADRGGWLPEIEMDDEDEVEPVETTDNENAILRRLAQSSDPKSIWAISDSNKGKQLLIGSSWSGVLNFSDKEAMDRFNAYVGKSSKKKPAMAEAA